MEKFLLNDTYEPGSVFKIITATAGLELSKVQVMIILTAQVSALSRIVRYDVIKSEDMEVRLSKKVL